MLTNLNILLNNDDSYKRKKSDATNFFYIVVNARMVHADAHDEELLEICFQTCVSL